MSVRVRRVILPNGLHCLELEEEHIGGSETQLSYEYKHTFDGEPVSTRGFKLDYWGRVEGLQVLD